MYKVSKRIEVAGAHRLELDYESKCSNLHGHNWIITVYCKTAILDRNGMVSDFSVISKFIKEKFDHKYLNDVFPNINPTAENIAKWIHDNITNCYKVTIQESEGNVACYED